MAAQCRSSKCTVERKGFRRELDTWRHKLINCVGFESILEGIYGPLLLRDLNIFDDCEPEELEDWAVKASCSFCSLLINDHVPVAASPLPSPSDDTPSQAASLSDSSLSAHRFLHAVFHKKELASGGDPDVPLVAQELMRRMVRQFATEYASKTRLTTSTDTPLDLTVTRNQEEEPTAVADTVLDLSKRNSASSASTSPTNHKASGSLLPTVTDEPQREAEDAGMPDAPSGRSSALEAVRSSLCPAHRSLLQRILRLAHQQHRLSLAYRDAHRRLVPPPDPLCCHLVAKQQDDTSSPPPFTDCWSRSATGATRQQTDWKPPGGPGCCCVQRCRLPPVCFCLQSLHCLSCQSLSLGHITTGVRSSSLCTFTSSPSLSSSALYPNPSVCPVASVCCSHPHPQPCSNPHPHPQPCSNPHPHPQPCSNPHPHPQPCASCCSEQTYLAPVRHTAQGGGGGGRDGGGGRREGGGSECPVLKREPSRTPSPPPLSPIPSDMDGKEEDKPPSLLQQQQEGEKEEEAGCGGEVGEDREQQDLVERFSDKLKTIRPQEKDPHLSSALANHNLEKDPHLTTSANQHMAESQADAHLSEIITTVLNTGGGSDYSLNDMLHHHDNNESQPPRTRSRRRQEALAAMTTLPDQSSTRRQTVLIKRELARLNQSLGRRLSLGKNKSRSAKPFSTCSSPEPTPVTAEMDRITEKEGETERVKEGETGRVKEGERERRVE
ncbi:uncharacterized protein LOC115185820 [Salmo trutta]|uniref:uncharacterized protein LOC115185820 n=1 Tax=Salmo trutta TaxID=8032 RepID=UPI0011300038|nr:uncharacterized protein LOC115185820 [Salmo trutta]